MNRVITKLRLLAFTLALITTANAQSIPKPAEILALTDVTVIDGSGRRPEKQRTIVIANGRILDIYQSGRKRLPAGAIVMNFRGRYVMPGLIDSHYHLNLDTRSKAEEEGLHRFALLGGITAVRDMAGDAIALSELAKKASDNNFQSPRVYFSALMAGRTWFVDERVKIMMHGLPAGEAPWARAIEPKTDIVKAVAEAKATGATGIKLYADLPPATVIRITNEAHRQGLKVWSHATIFPSKPSDAVKAGVDGISHSVMLVFELETKLPERSDLASYRNVTWKNVSVNAPAVTNLIRLMRRRGTILDDTIVHTALRQAPSIIKGEAARPASERIPGYAEAVENWAYNITRLAHQRGIPLVAGTDFQEHPESQEFPNIHTELELLVTKCGLTPLQAIRTATGNAAVLLGIQNSYGTIAKGNVADLVILSADPSVDIRNTTKIIYVIKGGRLHKREK